jgi:hypothetical protein
MNTTLFREPRWLAYLRALAFALPAIVTWGFACVMLVPKVKEICDRSGLEPAQVGWIWDATFFLVGYTKPILLWVTVTVVVAEWLGRKWLGPSRTTATLAAWLLNAAVLFGMTSLLIVVLIAAPGLMAPK